ncbi:MAG: DUF502 domain-containing protein [PVC group bacterium]|nr:DUF502 domain-containing protein [PVC group bacterium]
MMKTKLRRYFITGLVVLLPIVITVKILFASVKFIDNLLGRYINPLLENTFGTSFFGLGILAVIVLMFFTGLLATNVFVKKIVPFWERLFLRIPLVPQIYPAIKQLVKFLFSSDKVAFKKVVLFEYPLKNVYTIGFVTNEFCSQKGDDKEKDAVCVYISSAPNPITGFFVVVPKKDVIFLDISIEEAFKIIVSGGVLMRDDLLHNKVDFKQIKDD